MPTLLLYEAEGCTVLIQTRDGSLYRGRIEEVEDNWNIHMSNVVMKTRGSKDEFPFKRLFIRGANISFIVIPDMWLWKMRLKCRFKNSPMFQRVLDFKKGITAPKVVMDNSQRAMALTVRCSIVHSRIEVVFCFFSNNILKMTLIPFVFLTLLPRIAAI